MTEQEATKLMADFTLYSKYARHIEEKKRRESFDEAVERNKKMHLQKFDYYGELKSLIHIAFDDYVKNQIVLPSMRSMQFGGRAINDKNARIYNCSFMNIDNVACFSELLYLLMCGCGVGYSVQKMHIKKLPEIKRIDSTMEYIIEDSIEGWADSIKYLIGAYFGLNKYPKFVYDKIREEGSILKISGGRAPGYIPLKTAHKKINFILAQKNENDKLTSLEIHDINCFIADAVLSGGVRRSAMIALFDSNDESMINCKSGFSWFTENPQRMNANNSVVIHYDDHLAEEKFRKVLSRIRVNQTGEPGIFWTNNYFMGANPCVEIGLHSNQFCNLSTINVAKINNQKEFNDACFYAGVIGTAQACYTDFSYLRNIWRITTNKERLIGVSMTGIVNGNLEGIDLTQGVKRILEVNNNLSKALGINPAARTTAIKPEGTTSCLLNTSSGIHAYDSEYFIRRMTVHKTDSVYQFLMNNVPNLMEDKIGKENLDAYLCIPMKAPDGAVVASKFVDNQKIRSETAINTLERVKYFHDNWVKPGHRSGDNTNNVSCTVYCAENEWDGVTEWMWSNRKDYSGIALYPHQDWLHPQLIFEACTEEKYLKTLRNVRSLDFTTIVENIDSTSHISENIACAGGSCEI